MKIPRIKIKKYTGVFTILGFIFFIGALISHKAVATSLSLQFLACGFVIIAAQKNEELNPVKEALAKLELEREQLNNKFIQDIEELELSRVRYFEESEARVNELEQLKKVEIEEIIKLYENELNTLQEALILRENIISNSKLPKLSKGIGRIDVIANRIIDFYYSRELTLDFTDGWQESEYDLIRFTPKIGSKKQVEYHLEDLQIELKLNTIPSVEICQGSLQFKLNTSNIKTEVETIKRDKPSLVTGDWLRSVVAKIIHSKLDGETLGIVFNFNSICKSSK